MLIMEDVDDRVPLKTGTRLSFNNGRSYTVTDVIGMGGGGIVYKAVTPEGRTDAIKEIYPYELHRDRNDDGSIRFLGTDERDMYDIVCEDARQRESYFSRLTAGRGDNPNVIQSEFYRGVYINDSEQETDIAYLVMNRLVGCTLAEFIDECGCRVKTGCPYRRGGLPDIRTTAAIIRSILYAVKRIHNIPQPGQACDTGYLINDIKAENIYMYGISFADRNSDWFPFIIDYGSVQKLDAQRSNMITEDVKHSAYTEGYASWEMQNSDVLRITPASDLYSVGRIFLYMITGEEFRVAAGDTLTMFADCNDDTNIKVALGYAQRRMKETGCSDYSFETVTRIIEKSITNNAADRYQTADEFIKDIDELIERCDVSFYLRTDLPESIAADDFASRDTEIAELDRLFENNRLIIVTGASGIGKTQLALKYAEHFEASTENAVAIYRQYDDGEENEDGRLDALIRSIRLYAPEDEMDADMVRYAESDEKRYEILKSICDDRTLLIIDNFNSGSRDELDRLAELGAHVLIITDDYTVHEDYAGLDIGPLAKSDAVGLYRSKCPSAADDREDYISDIIAMVAGNTGLIIIVAKRQWADHITADDMETRLYSGMSFGASGLSIMEDEDDEANVSFREKYQKLFLDKYMNSTRIYILRYLAQFGAAYVETDSFMAWTGLTDYTDIDYLVRMRQINRNKYNEITVPAVIGAAVRKKYAVKSLCEIETFIRNFAEKDCDKSLDVYYYLIANVLFILADEYKHRTDMTPEDIMAEIDIAKLLVNACSMIYDKRTLEVLFSLCVVIMHMAEKLNELTDGADYNRITDDDALKSCRMISVYRNCTDINEAAERFGMSVGEFMYQLKFKTFFWRLMYSEQPSHDTRDVLEELASHGDTESITVLAQCILHKSEYLTDDELRSALRLLSQAVAVGNPEAKLLLAEMYYMGNGIEKSLYEAEKLIRDAAQAGCHGAVNFLGYLYEDKEYAGYNPDMAMKYYREGAEQGDIMSINNIYKLLIDKCEDKLTYKNGKLRELPDEAKDAIRYLKRAAAYGLPLAMSNYAVGYQTGLSGCIDYERAFELQRRAADSMNPVPLSRLALMYHDGTGCTRDDAAWVDYMLEAYEHGDLRAAYQLGNALRDGEGIKKDVSRAMQMYQVGVEKGYPECFISLSSLYIVGPGELRNYSRGIEILQNGADRGYIDCITMLAREYVYGINCHKNAREAVKLIDRALSIDPQRGEAYELLGMMYKERSIDGRIRCSNISKSVLPANKNPDVLAFACYKKAAQLGNINAMYELACAYMDGVGTGWDGDAARELFERVIEAGQNGTRSDLADKARKKIEEMERWEY